MSGTPLSFLGQAHALGLLAVFGPYRKTLPYTDRYGNLERAARELHPEEGEADDEGEDAEELQEMPEVLHAPSIAKAPRRTVGLLQII